MAFAISNPIGTGTDQELVDFTRAAIAQITLHGQMYTTSGRTLTRADLKTLHDQLAIFEARVNAAAGSASRNKENLARFQRPA
jgi:hypothetical protein